MRTIEKLDKYVVAPNVAFYGGFVYDGEDIFLCSDHDTDEGYDFVVNQKIENDKLITDLTREYTIKGDKTVKESSHLEIEIEKGQLIVYVEGTGYTLPEYKMVTVDEAVTQYNILRGEFNDLRTDEEESPCSNRGD
ncbi:MAG: hypothetical protein MJZ37_06465 [Bacilli bacterium]|nr:hypothetical protein [Bacilli bacterium]